MPDAGRSIAARSDKDPRQYLYIYVRKWSILALFIRKDFRLFCPFLPQPWAGLAKMSENRIQQA